MAESSRSSRAEQLKQKPEPPSMYVGFAGVLAIAAFMFGAVWHGLVITLAVLCFLLLLLLSFTCYFGYRAHSNKKKLYTMYEEMKKLAETQSRRAKEAEDALEENHEVSAKTTSLDREIESIRRLVRLFSDYKERQRRNEK